MPFSIVPSSCMTSYGSARKFLNDGPIGNDTLRSRDIAFDNRDMDLSGLADGLVALLDLLGDTSMAFSEEANQDFGDPEFNNPEEVILRPSDDTPLLRPGSLGPGIQLRSGRVNLWAVDAAVKYRGWSVSGEYLLRLLNDFEGRPTSAIAILNH
jgi:hypothetical protein